MNVPKAILTAALLVSVTQKIIEAAPAKALEHCSARFQEAFQEIVQLKRFCRGIHYKDCCQTAEVFETLDYDFKSGVYEINNPCEEDSPFSLDISPMHARCNMESNDGGWTVLIRRTPEPSEQTSFARKWKDYENGFGNLSGEFWYGLKNMHCLTSREPMEVEVEASKIDGTKTILSYGNFKIDSPSTSYTLHVSDKQHKGSDLLGGLNGLKFTTTDRDNDKHGGINCAEIYPGGWWFNSCYAIHLTDTTNPKVGSSSAEYDYAELRVRPKSCTTKSSICEN